MHKFEQEIKDHQDSIAKSINNGFVQEPIPTFAVENIEELKKSYDVFTKDNLTKFAEDCQTNFIKGLEANEDVDVLKKALSENQEMISGLSKIRLVSADSQETIVFVAKKAEVLS